MLLPSRHGVLSALRSSLFLKPFLAVILWIVLATYLCQISYFLNATSFLLLLPCFSGVLRKSAWKSGF